MSEEQKHSIKQNSIQPQRMKTIDLRNRRKVYEANSPVTSSRSDSPKPNTKGLGGGGGNDTEMDTQERSESRTSRFTKIETVLHMLKYVCQLLRYAGTYGH